MPTTHLTLPNIIQESAAQTKNWQGQIKPFQAFLTQRVQALRQEDILRFERIEVKRKPGTHGT